MIRMNKRLLGFALSLALIIGLLPFTAASAAPAQNVMLNLDGKKVSFSGAQPQLIGGKIYVPYATLASQLKATVKTEAKKTTITLNGKSLAFTTGTVNATINGKAVKLEGAPVSKDKAVLVPARAISDAFGIWVSWNGSTKTVSLNRTKTVKHALGETKLNGVPQRVVILFNGMVDTSVLLGVKPVGAVESYLQQPFYEYLRPSLIGVKDLGDETQPNLEGIAALKPDLIIASKMRHEKINDQLNKIAPTVHTEDVFSWQANLKFAADVLNKQPQADAYLANWNKRVAEFAAFVDRARRVRRGVAWNPARERKLPEQPAHAGLVLRHVGIKLAVGPLQPRVGDHPGCAVSRPGDEQHVGVQLPDDPVEMDIDEVQAGRGAPMSEQPRLDMLPFQRLAQQRIGQQVDLAHRQVVRRPPPGVHQPGFVG